MSKTGRCRLLEFLVQILDKISGRLTKMEISVYKDKRSMWRWRAVANNRKIVADSGEGYYSKSNAKRAAVRFINAICSKKLVLVVKE